MQPTSLARALKIAAEHFGRNDRAFLLQKINESRRALFKSESTRKIFFKGTDCECVSCFRDWCNTSRCTTYSGITLPVNAVGIEYLEHNGRRIDIVGERLPDSGCCNASIGHHLYPCAEAELLSSKPPLRIEIPAIYKNRIRFRAKETADKGKLVGVHYVSTDGVVIREDLELSTTGVITSRNVVEFKAITLPERCGFVDACLIDGFVLDSYHPAILAPRHPRLRLKGIRVGQVVSWFATVEPLDVMFDTDLVEFSSELDWRNTFMFLDLHFKEGKSGAEMFAYKAALQMTATSGDAELKASLPTPVTNLRPKNVGVWRKRVRWLDAR